MKLVPPTFPLPGGPILQSGPYRRKHKISIGAVLHSLTWHSFEKLFLVQERHLEHMKTTCSSFKKVILPAGLRCVIVYEFKYTSECKSTIRNRQKVLTGRSWVVSMNEIRSEEFRETVLLVSKKCYLFCEEN
jgi:hypothetical protein